MADINKQVEIAERLQMKWLTHMENLLDSGEISATDMSTLFKFLQANGWSIDPSRLPKGLREHITTPLTAEELEREDELAVRRQAI